MRILLILSLVLCTYLVGLCQHGRSVKHATIRYAIVYNQIAYHDPRTDDLDLVSLDDALYSVATHDKRSERRMTLIMRPQEFSRKNLVDVFDLVKKRFPEPVHLGIFVFTDLSMVKTPEENDNNLSLDELAFSGLERSWKWAFFRRDETDENFLYTDSLRPHKDAWAFPFNPATQTTRKNKTRKK